MRFPKFALSLCMMTLVFSAPAVASAAASSVSGVSPGYVYAHPAIRQVTRHKADNDYTVRSGDTLTGIAGKLWHKPWRWPLLYWANRHTVHNPSSIRVGEHLTVPADPRVPNWMREKAYSHIPKPPAPVAHVAVRHSAPSQPSAPTPDPVTAPAPTTGPRQIAGGAFEQCVIQAESGGDPSAVNPSTGAGGLFGFLPSTWAALGFPGLPNDAPVSMQYAAFAKLYAEQGTAPWAPYDGC